MSVNIQIRNSDGPSNSLVLKNHIKYLGVMIDDGVPWSIRHCRVRFYTSVGQPLSKQL